MEIYASLLRYGRGCNDSVEIDSGPSEPALFCPGGYVVSEKAGLRGCDGVKDADRRRRRRPPGVSVLDAVANESTFRPSTSVWFLFD